MTRDMQDSIRPATEFARPAHIERLLADLPGRVPTPTSALAGVVILLTVASAALLYEIPWLQTSAGAGQVVTLNPSDRLQSVSALVDGRIHRWYVNDGSVVKAGDPIVEVVDVDPEFIGRIRAERAALAHRLEASRVATETAKLDVDRQQRLFEEGLSSRKDYEMAQIKYKEYLAKESEARAGLSKTDIELSRQSSQIVRAPQDGRIMRILAGNKATFVKAGEEVATFAPDRVVRAVEIYVSGLDAPLVQLGMRARIMFEGWPAVQFSGWPNTALGTFAGEVAALDPAVSANGRFRVLLRELTDEPWPDARFLRLGGQAKAWVQLSEVRLGYELWRRLNQFPPRPVVAADSGKS